MREISTSTQIEQVLAGKWAIKLDEAGLLAVLPPGGSAIDRAGAAAASAISLLVGPSAPQRTLAETNRYADLLAQRLTQSHLFSLNVPMNAFMQACYVLEDCVLEVFDADGGLSKTELTTINRFFRHFVGAASKFWMEELQKQRDLVSQHAGELEAVIGHMADGVFISDAQGLDGEVNTAGRQILDLASSSDGNVLSLSSAAGVLRDRYGETLSKEQHPLYRALFLREIVRQDEIRVLSKAAGTHTLSVSAAPVLNESSELVAGVVVFRDITDEKQLEVLKDDFLAIASHELRTPLTSVKAYAQLTRRRLTGLISARPNQAEVTPQLQKLSDNLTMINVQADKLALMINELLDVSRIQTGRLDLNKRRADLNQLTRRSIEGFASTLEANPVRFTQCPEPLVVNVDPERIKQIVTSLISNAHRFSPDSEPIEVTTLQTTCELTGIPCAQLSVRDYGIGIAENDLPRVFERFYRSSTPLGSHYRGMGVGLFVSSEIAKHHNGTMWVTSELGKGSTFSFKLPLVQQ
jgi:two-component system, OmpR family, sensor histidine kinase VicK